MTAARRLLLHMLAWAAAIPLLSLSLSLLEQHHVLDVSGSAAAIMGVALLLWAGLIYWRAMPPAHSIAARLTGAATYLAAMAVLGVGAVWITFWATVLIFGV
ncbi:hypothetical protein M2165_003122 [Variovorax sp. TBS-050B]|uniref:hypothetical protein n=1 Tax=Variovorax sp. TBS-050B TaxID=2940551 RepID=UPI00247408C6|nr:hypothetical protein [Variovorax sp. TBS-050B]MDH6593233.1 hypothetical protein [Variovorax sp. TBS-050B]